MSPLLWRYARLFRPHLPALLGSAALMSLTAAVPASAVLLLREALDRVLGGGEVGAMGGVAAGFAGLYLLDGAARLVRTRVTKGVAWGVVSRLRRELHAHTLRLGPGPTGARLACLTGEVDELQYGVSAAVTALRNPVTLLGLAATAAVLAPRLAPWALLLLPLVYLPSRWGGRRLRRLSEQVQRSRLALSALAVEQLEGAATLQAYGAGEQESLRFAAEEERYRASRLRLEVERVLPSALVQTLAAGGVGALLWLGASQVAAGSLEPGALVGFVVALGLMSRPLSGLSEVWSLLQRALVALEEVERLLREPALPEDPAAPLPLPEGPLTLAWDQVRADWGRGEVLSGVSLEARPGELLALVGPSGAGKSSLLAVALRALSPSAGGVTLGGVAVERLALAELRRAVAVVRSEDAFFHRTVRENLSLGRALPPQALDAALDAGEAGFLRALPEGLDHLLQRGGADLSAGQRQRLALARALAGEARVLLLDEVTHQVDAETARAIHEALLRLRPGRTLVVVAHDLAQVEGADQVAVVEGGRVVERGNHPELLKAGGRYAALWAAREGR
ncbi:MAG: ABC transporter ATP-binding protein [Deltaproteobacteria bacterium]|nr:ABC transporter ATP-binding protein [Deltaproteobacteria bacterium]